MCRHVLSGAAPGKRDRGRLSLGGLQASEAGVRTERDSLKSCEGRGPALAQLAGRSRNAACEARGWAGPGPGSGRSKPERTGRHRPLRHSSPPFPSRLRHLFRLRSPIRSGFRGCSFSNWTQDFRSPNGRPLRRSEKDHLLGCRSVAHKLLARRPGWASGEGWAGCHPALLHGETVAFGVDIAFMPGWPDAPLTRAAVTGGAPDFEGRVARPPVATVRAAHVHGFISASSARARASRA